jgi:hypothetical protein
MLVTAYGYNPKNILERVSDHGRLSPSMPADERSRWGMPSMEKLFPTNLNRILGSTKVEDWSHRVDDKGLHIRNTFTRCCMEGMTYYPTIECTACARPPTARSRKSVSSTPPPSGWCMPS